jgi:hypothetical protein
MLEWAIVGVNIFGVWVIRLVRVFDLVVADSLLSPCFFVKSSALDVVFGVGKPLQITYTVTP